MTAQVMFTCAVMHGVIASLLVDYSTAIDRRI